MPWGQPRVGKLGGELVYRRQIPSWVITLTFSICMFVVYAIKSKTKNFIYVWMTSNLSRRINDHQNWKNLSTKWFTPFELIYTEECNTSSDARKREKFLKSWVGKEMLKLKIK